MTPPPSSCGAWSRSPTPSRRPVATADPGGPVCRGRGSVSVPRGGGGLGVREGGARGPAGGSGCRPRASAGRAAPPEAPVSPVGGCPPSGRPDGRQRGAGGREGCGLSGEPAPWPGRWAGRGSLQSFGTALLVRPGRGAEGGADAPEQHRVHRSPARDPVRVPCPRAQLPCLPTRPGLRGLSPWSLMPDPPPPAGPLLTPSSS